MPLFAHHIELSFFGCDLSPETMPEHVAFFGLTAALLALAGYGVSAALRDLRNRTRQPALASATVPPADG